MTTQTRAGQQVEYISEDLSGMDLRKDMMYLQVFGGQARYILLIGNDVKIKGPVFLFECDRITQDERDSMDEMTRAKRTGWYRENWGQGEWTCAYCGAIAHSPRVVNFPCPCRHGKDTD